MFKAPIDFLHELWVQKPISIIGDKITWHLILQSLKLSTIIHYLQLYIVYNYSSSTVIYSLGRKKVANLFFVSFLFKLFF